jgi:RNA polymerase sigma-70 factor (ECF subfamily)
MDERDPMDDDESRQIFDSFVNTKQRRLVGYAYLLTGDFQESQDLVQEALTRLWERWGRIRSYDDPEGWVRRVVFNLASNHRRSVRRRDPWAVVDLAVGAPDVDHLDVLAALLRLPLNQRRAIVLHDVIDMTVPDVAREMRVPEGSVRGWVSRGRKALVSDLNLPVVPSPRGSR